MNNTVKNLLLAGISVLTLAACKKMAAKAPGNMGSQAPKTTNVYICGNVITTGSDRYFQACYWKNGQLNYLPDESTGSVAYCIFVADTDVYIGGAIGTSAAYWKNGVPHSLGDADTASCRSIVVLNDTIYAAVNGDENIGVTVSSYYVMIPPSGAPVFSNLRDILFHPQVNSIAVSNGKVYCAGAGTDTTGVVFGNMGYAQTPESWYGTVETSLDYLSFFSQEAYKGGIAAGVAVSGNDVYFAGQEFFSVPTEFQPDFVAHPVYWKNQTAIELDPDPLTPAIGRCTGIALSGADIYLAGQEYAGSAYKPCSWKNGAISFLSNGSGSANGISVLDSNVYIAGDQPINSGFNGAVYWKNGADTALSPNLYASEAYAIMAVKQ
jgi:hypothetical protein